MIFHGEKHASRPAIDTRVAHDLGQMTIWLRRERLLKSKPRQAILCIRHAGSEVVVGKSIQIKFAGSGPTGFVVEDGSCGGVAQVERGALRTAHAGPSNGSLGHRVRQADISIGGKTIAEQNISLDVNTVGGQRVPSGIFECAAVAFEIIANLRAEKIHFSVCAKTGAKKCKAADVDAVCI